MQDDIVSIRDCQRILISQSDGERFGEVEESVTTGSNVGAVLDIVGRPEVLGSSVITSVEERLEGFDNYCLVLCCWRLIHGFSLIRYGQEMTPH